MSLVVAGIFTLVIVHALLAVRKFPINYRQYRSFRDHANDMKHGDTTLWWWQVVTGFALFFLVSIHLYVMLTQPETIGPYRQRRPHLDRPLLAAVPGAVVRGGTSRRHRPVPAGRQVGLVLRAPTPMSRVRRLKTLKWALTVFFLVLGLATLAAYIKIGIEHAPRAGEPYTPSWVQPSASPPK